MRKLIKLLVLLLVTNCVFATDYYISNSGSDANNGTSPTTAWATISKLNASWASILSGDRIFFERGGTFFGSINVTKSGITLGAYGTGAKPIITGFYTIPSWTAAGTNLWTATIPTSLNNVRLLTINGKITRVGRFPNYSDDLNAWFRYSNTIGAVSPVTITKETRAASDPANFATTIPTSHVGGEAVLFKNNWTLDIMPITAISGNNLTCTNPGGLWGIDANPYYGNWGFFIQNTLAALDQQTEWHFSNSSKVITMFSSTNPSTLGEIKFPIIQNLISLGAQSNITIDGLDIQGATEKGVISNGATNIAIRNCTLRYIAGWALEMRSNGVIVEDNLIRDIGSNGVWCTGSASVRRNVFKSIGMVEGAWGLTNSGAGTQGNGTDQEQAIALYSSNGQTCFENIIDSVGHVGIRYYGSNISMERNVIKNYCLIKSDGGAIYSWDENTLPSQRSNRLIKKNIMLYGNKALWGTGYPYLVTGAYGLYFDGGVNNVVADSNVVGYSIYGPNSSCNTATLPNQTDDGAVLLNGATTVTLRNTITFGWPQALMICNWRTIPPPAGLRITNNALYARGTNYNANDKCTWTTSLKYLDMASSTGTDVQTQIRNMGVIDSNYVVDFLVSPYRPGSQSYDAPAFSIANWRTYSGKSAKDTTFPSTTADFQVNETGTPRTYSFPGLSKIDFKGTVYNNSAVIPPYYANIFFPNGSAPSGNAPVVTATATTITCNGASSTVTVTATGGTPPYTGTGTFTRTAGTYTFTVTDAANVSGSTSITINQPAALTAGNPTAPAITTAGGTTTITQPVPTGGTAPYQYQLGTGVFQGTNTFSGVVAGTYTITIRDACSTTITKSITIAPYTAPAYQARIVSVNYGASTWAQNETRNVTVTIQNTGSATWTDGSGTTRDINVAIKWNGWSDYHSRTDAHPCAPGETKTYTLSIRAANATQSASGTGNVNNVTPIYSTALALGSNNLTIDLVNERQCWFANNSGGCGPGNTRYVSPAITIVAPAPVNPLAATSTATAIACSGDSSTITVSATGGTSPYTGTGTFKRVAGTHTFTITDAAGASTTTTVIITQPTVLSVTANATTITCVGGNSTITLGATGGTSPYTGTGTFTRTAGTQTFTVTDANGCLKAVTITLSDPQIVTPVISIN